jgi:hypothetical protein
MKNFSIRPKHEITYIADYMQTYEIFGSFCSRDLSYNKELGGSLPSSIGSLSNLQNLWVMKLGGPNWFASPKVSVHRFLLTYLFSRFSAESLLAAALLVKYLQRLASSQIWYFCKGLKLTYMYLTLWTCIVNFPQGNDIFTIYKPLFDHT